MSGSGNLGMCAPTATNVYMATLKCNKELIQELVSKGAPINEPQGVSAGTLSHTLTLRG